jgi:hypothetical protein
VSIQLFDDYQSVTSKCQVNRSPNIEQGILYIDDGLWLFYNTYLTPYCQIHSTSNELTETISINEAAIVRIPCDKTVTCADFQLPAASCKANRVIITLSFTSNIHNLPHFIVPIKNMTQTLLSAYRIQLEKSIKDLMSTSSGKQLKFKETIYDYALSILAALCSMFIMIFIHIYKIIKYRLRRKMNNFEAQLEDIVNL